MKLQAQPLFLLILLAFLSYSSEAQTIFVVNGAKVNMKDSVYLSTNNITVLDTGSINAAGSVLKIAGNTESSGAIDVSNGTAELNGAYPQQLEASAFTRKYVKALTINNLAGATVNDTLNVSDVLTVSSGKLISQGFLTLKSNDSNTARVAEVTSLAAVPISGDVIVERYIIPKRAYRFLTAPVNASTTIRDNWMEGVYNPNTTSGNVNPVPGFGTHITGAGGHLNHFDETNTNNSSLFTYNLQTQSWKAATNTDTLLKAGQAFSILIRGNRTTNLNNNAAAPSPTTLRAKGALVTGTVVLKAEGAGGTPGMPALSAVRGAYSFIANPYASPVDWLKTDIKDISSTIYIFDPHLSGRYGRGVYVAYNRSIGSISNDSSKIDNNIQSGQSFFVQTTGADPTFTFRESYKTSANRRVFRPIRLPKLSLQLLIPRQQGVTSAADGLSAFFSDDFSPSFGNEDSYKFTNEEENIAIMRAGKTLSIEGRKPVTANDTIPLKMWQLSLKNYLLKVAIKNFDNEVEGYVEDAFLHTNTKLSHDTATVVPFAITTDTLSAASNRFKIVFKISAPLATDIVRINAYEINKGVQIKWTLNQEDNIDSCIVEKSADAKQFAAIGAVKAGSNASSAFNWFDANPITGDNYYRIKYDSRQGVSKYSNIVKVSLHHQKGSISIVSNTGDKNSLILSFKNIAKGKYALNFVNNIGQKIYSGSIEHAGGSANQVIKIRNLLPAGLYHLQISGVEISQELSVLVP